MWAGQPHRGTSSKDKKSIQQNVEYINSVQGNVCILLLQ